MPVLLAAGAAIFSSILSVSAQTDRDQSKIILNPAGLEQAKELIRQNRFTADHKGEWKEHRPSTGDENEFIRRFGFAEYSKWYLAIDRRYPENTKARYKFPYGDFNTVHRCGLLAVQSRAHQYGHAEVERAATALIGMLASDDQRSQAVRKAATN